MTTEDSQIISTTTSSENSFWYNVVTWSSASVNMLRNAEKKILNFLKTPYKGFYIDVGKCVGESDKIWTISMNSQSDRTPLVLLHGLGAGSALWVMNYDSFAKNRPVYSIDILGFGRSSRPNFAKDAETAEIQFVKSIEEWRKEANIKKMILLGHSMGGFLGCAYALSHPDRVQHLILADPWGFPERPDDVNTKYNVPFWVKGIAYAVQPLNPLWPLRMAGPWGQWLVERARPDIIKKFNNIVTDETAIPQYLHQANVQSPTGESAFHSMMSGFGWAKNPMIKRIHEIQKDVPITLIYGSRSWVDSSASEIIAKVRPDSYVKSFVINQAGHHVYADKAEEFNQIVVEACKKFEENSDESTELEE